MTASPLTKASVGPDGVTLAPVAVNGTDGNTFQTGQGVALFVVNASGSSVTATFGYPGKYDGTQTPPARTLVVAAGANALFPLRDVYADPATGRGLVTWSSATSVTAQVVALP